MTGERAFSLLNTLVDSMCVGGRTFDVIENLLQMGFSEDELVELDFQRSDVEIVAQDIDEENC